MAIDVCSEISSTCLVISPRISFSHDLDQTDHPIQHRLDTSLLDSSSDFDFCFTSSFVQELSSADELFSNGKILPIQIKKRLIPTKQNRGSDSVSAPASRPRPSGTERCSEKKMMLKEFLSTDGEEKTSSLSKPFLQFRRSSSLNCDTSRGKSLIRSLQFLSRSNSTGSAPNPKQSVLGKEFQSQSKNQQRPHLQKHSSVPSRKSSSSSSSSSTFYPYKPPLKKCGSYGGSGGVRISSVLNLPPPYISRATVNLFGFGSLFCNGKFTSKKKKK